MQHDPFQATFGDLLDTQPRTKRANLTERTPPSRTGDAETMLPAEPVRRPSSGLSREQVIDRIVTINTSATQAFLNRFGTASLHRYLEHLDVASGPRGRGSGWQRPEDSPAIVSYDAAV